MHCLTMLTGHIIPVRTPRIGELMLDISFDLTRTLTVFSMVIVSITWLSAEAMNECVRCVALWKSSFEYEYILQIST